jgi:serine/threonine protein kinase
MVGMNGEVGAGARLGSLYVLDQRIGIGAMGAVWAAHNTESDAPVAIKILSDNLAQDPDLVGRFLRERSALLSVRHPNLVEIKDLVVENERIALVMELIQGVDAARLLEQGGPMPLYQAARLGAEISEALVAVHAAGIVHRDLKPANILIESATGAARLVDFGIAWIAGKPRVTAADSLIGTPYYLAPELLAGGAVSPAADVYALAVCLYQLLAGVVPFDGEHYAEVLHKHLYEAPQPHPAIPPTVWSILEAMLAKDPAARPSAQFVAGQLAKFADSAAAPAQYQPESQQPDQQQPAYQEPDSSLYTQIPTEPFGDYYEGSAPPPPGPWADGEQQAGYPQSPGYAPPPPADPFVAGPGPFFYSEPEPSRWAGRKRWLVAAGTVVALGLIAGGVVYATGNHGSTPVAASTAHSASPSPSPLTVAQQRVGRWALIGNATDSIGSRDGVATGVKWTVTDSTHGSAAFTGQADSQILAQGAPVISTAHSFTIAVWVVMNGPTSTSSGWQTVVALRGSTSEGAALEYNATADRWAFDMSDADSATAATDSVLSHAAPAKSWYHLVATYDATSHAMSLYVNKVRQGTGSHAPDWAAAGPLSIGSGISHGASTNWLHGAVSDVQMWKIPLTLVQIEQLG